MKSARTLDRRGEVGYNKRGAVVAAILEQLGLDDNMDNNWHLCRLMNNRLEGGRRGDHILMSLLPPIRLTHCSHHSCSSSPMGHVYSTHEVNFRCTCSVIVMSGFKQYR